MFRLPMFVIAAALLGLIALLATLQYRWLGQITDAERARMTATLNDRAKAFGEDVDRELTRAYLLFQIDEPATGTPAHEIATRYERWQATARFPRLIKDVYLVDPARAGEPRSLERYDPAAHALEFASWPAALAPVKSQVVRAQSPEFNPQHLGAGTSTFFYRALVPSAWPDVPALVISSPLVMVNRDTSTDRGKPAAMFPSAPRYTVLLLDGDFMRRDMLPAHARQHFRDDGVDYRLAVVPTSGRADSIFRSTDQFTPTADAPADARVDLFQVRTQDFSAVASEVSRFVTFSAAWHGSDGTRTERIIRETMTASSPKIASAPFSIVFQGSSRGGGSPAAGAITSTTSQLPRWRLLVRHPSGSLESAVNSARRRNLAISSSVLGILGLSVALLFVSTRRANDLARQQLEFVATVSHELRTPLAVIRSAADNLADGVVHDESRVRQYGELVRREGVRLTDLVEQILEFAGLQSGQRSLARRPVEIDGVLREVAAATQEATREPLTIDLAVADRLPAVVGDEAALRRAFQNLIGNAVKYGAGAGWAGVEAVAEVSRLVVTVRDRGIGIAPADQERIFDPFYRAADVVSAQIQGAGLGLSLVKRIVEAHGGRVTVDSAPGKGSAFVVSLPIASGTAAEGPVVEAATQHS